MIAAKTKSRRGLLNLLMRLEVQSSVMWGSGDSPTGFNPWPCSYICLTWNPVSRHFLLSYMDRKPQKESCLAVTQDLFVDTCAKAHPKRPTIATLETTRAGLRRMGPV